MNLRDIAHALGGDVTGRNSINAPGPNHGPADRSLAIVFHSRAPAGFVVYSHSGDDPLECRDHVKTRLGLGRLRSNAKGHGIPIVVSDAGPDTNKARNKEFALKIWSQSIDPKNTIVEHYLREHRGLPLTDDIAGTVIRYHRGLHFDGVIVPGMVCLFRNILTDAPCGIHRTFLRSDDGQKIDRRMLGIAKAAAIKLDAQATISTALTIGEGIETGLASRVAGFGPVWALGSSGAVGSFTVLPSLTEITILEENDITSRRNVQLCARRYLNARKPVNVVTSDVGNDLNDAWQAVRS